MAVDQFSSVENMLQWQIDAAKKRIKDTRDALNKCGELHPLPKPADGLPDNWAFGKLTHHEVSLNDAMQGLLFADSQLNLTETDLSNGDLPSAIYRIIQVNQSINSAGGKWVSAASLSSYRYIKKYRKTQAKNSQKSRSKVKEIIENLALSTEYENESAKQLWVRFYSELELQEFDPEESINETGSGKSSYEYNFLDKRKVITSRSFENVISQFRKFKSR